MKDGWVTRHIQVADGLWLKIEAPADMQGQALADDLVNGARALLGLASPPTPEGQTP